MLSMSENLVILKSIVPLFSEHMKPHLKYSMKFFIKSSSLALWVIIKLNLVASPNLEVTDLKIPTLKQPSPFTNPVNQKGFISWYPTISTSGLRTEVLFGKATLKVSLKPLFRFAFKDTSLSNPSCVKCDLLIIRSYANLNKA